MSWLRSSDFCSSRSGSPSSWTGAATPAEAPHMGSPDVAANIRGAVRQRYSGLSRPSKRSRSPSSAAPSARGRRRRMRPSHTCTRVRLPYSRTTVRMLAVACTCWQCSQSIGGCESAAHMGHRNSFPCAILWFRGQVVSAADASREHTATLALSEGRPRLSLLLGPHAASPAAPPSAGSAHGRTPGGRRGGEGRDSEGHGRRRRGGVSALLATYNLVASYAF